MNAPTTPMFTPARIVALALIVLLIGGLAYLRFAPDGGSVSVPKGAHAGQLTPAPLPLRDREGQLRRRLRHARRAREPRRPAVAADRAAGHPHPRPSRRTRPSRSSASRAAPASRTCSFSKASRLRRRPRRRPRRLPRRRRLVEARLPRGRVGAQPLDRLPRPRSRCRAYARRVALLRRPADRRRRRPRRLRPRRSRSRSRGGAQGARLRAHRPRQRERRNAHGDDLRLALPEAASTAR